MRAFVILAVFSALIPLLLSVSIIAKEDLELQRHYNRQDNPSFLWHLQISTPSKRADYPPSFIWYSGAPYKESTLSPIFGNQIYFKKDLED